MFYAFKISEVDYAVQKYPISVLDCLKYNSDETIFEHAYHERIRMHSDCKNKDIKNLPDSSSNFHSATTPGYQKKKYKRTNNER
jgi:hypothetical protein